MKDMQLRMIEVAKILNSDLIKYEKVVQACRQLSGLDITHTTQTIKNSIGEHLHEMNDILSHYSSVIKNWEDYQLISEEHLNKMLNSIKRLSKKLILS